MDADQKKVELLRKKLKQWQIETVLWDFDGTLVDTTNHYLSKMIDACMIPLYGKIQKQKEKLERARKTAEEVMTPAIWSFHDQYGVNPMIMEMAVITTAKLIGLKPGSARTEPALKKIRTIQISSPKVLPGAVEIVEMVTAAGGRPVLATHANREWTWIKVAQSGFIGKFEKTLCFAVDKPKAGQWQAQIGKLKTASKNMLVVGDNFKGDILPILKLGGRGVWIANTKRVGSETISPKELKKTFKNKVVVIEKISELVDAVLETEF